MVYRLPWRWLGKGDLVAVGGGARGEINRVKMSHAGGDDEHLAWVGWGDAARW